MPSKNRLHEPVNVEEWKIDKNELHTQASNILLRSLYELTHAQQVNMPLITHDRFTGNISTSMTT